MKIKKKKKKKKKKGIFIYLFGAFGKVAYRNVAFIES